MAAALCALLCLCYSVGVQATEPRTSAVTIGDGSDTVIKFIDETSANTTIDSPFSGGTASMLDIDVSGTSGISFATGDYAGKNLKLYNANVAYRDDIVDTDPRHVEYLISAKNTNGNAAAIDLTNTSTETGTFTVELVNSETAPKVYKFLSDGVRSSGEAYAAAIGVPNASAKSAKNFHFKTNGATVKISSSSSSSGYYFYYAAAFGAGFAYGSGGGSVSFDNWQIGAIGTGAVISSSSSGSYYSSFGAAFGAGRAEVSSSTGGSVSFDNWRIGAIGSGAVVSSFSSSGSTTSYGAAFGAGSAYVSGSGGSVSFASWHIGAIGTGAVVSSSSSSGSSSYGAAFGAGHAYGSTGS
ncbi:MAG: hypothetical protein LBB18_03455, partial [Puniceicoccales bacterium]|nr:hypothetical protein [Puniceicoccales bacterium]